MDLEFFDDPATFLEAADALLAAEPVLGTVIGTVTTRMAELVSRGERPRDWVGGRYEPWWLVVRDDSGAVVSAAMRNAPFEPYPLFVLPMPEEAARELGSTLHGRAEVVGGANGALPAVRVVAAEVARLAEAQVDVAEHTRLFEATEVTVPEAPVGRLRRAVADDADVVLSCFHAFGAEADAQAGRPPGTTRTDHFTRDEICDRIATDTVWLFESPSGEPLHLTSASSPVHGVSRIGPVYTPREHRGRGVASYVVGEATRHGLAQGHRMCLFTDQANPTSNRIYECLGYRRVTDMANLVVRNLEETLR